MKPMLLNLASFTQNKQNRVNDSRRKKHFNSLKIKLYVGYKTTYTCWASAKLYCTMMLDLLHQ